MSHTKRQWCPRCRVHQDMAVRTWTAPAPREMRGPYKMVLAHKLETCPCGLAVRATTQVEEA